MGRRVIRGRRMILNGYEVSLWGDGNVLKLIIVMVAHYLWIYWKCWIIYFTELITSYVNHISMWFVFWWCWVFGAAQTLQRREQGLLSGLAVVHGLLTAVASPAVGHAHGPQRLRLLGSGAQAWQLWWTGMWDIPRPGSNLCPLHWQADSSPRDTREALNVNF